MIRRLQAAALRVQLPLVVLFVPLVLALMAVPLMSVAVEVALDGQPDAVIDQAAGAVRVVAWLLVAGVAITALAAAAVLRASLGATVDELADATDAIARGNFRFRIASTRTDELGHLARSIDAMAERLERLEAGRRTMLACVSHELRTPLTIIRGHAFTLGRDEADPGRRSRLQLMQDESVRLASLIEDLVDASALTAGSVRLSVERCDVVARITQAAHRFSSMAHDVGVDIRVEGCDRRVHADIDPGRFDQVLANLLANAVRHADPASAVVIGLGVRGRGSARAAFIDVTNVGPPVEPETAARMFEPFEQGEASSSGRLGLGLTIAQAIAHAHAGRIELHRAGSDTDRRVVFRVTVPIVAVVRSGFHERRDVTVRVASST